MADISKLKERIGDYVVRVATPEDYKSIVDIDDNLLFGFDYLPIMFYEFLQSKRYLMLVFEDRGQPFSLLVIGLDAEKPTVASLMGVRISQSKRGKDNRERSQELGAQETHGGAISQGRSNVPHGFRNWTWVYFEAAYTHWIKIKQHVLVCATSTSSIHDRLSRHQPSSNNSVLRAMTYAEVAELLINGQQWEQFFSQYATDYVVGHGNWKPVRIHGKSDLREMFCAASLILVTTDDGRSTEIKRRDAPPMTSTIGKVLSLSCSYALPVKFGLVYHIMFYGNDPVLAAQHEIQQARRLTEIWQGDVGIVLLIPYQMNISQVTSLVDGPIGSHQDIYGCAEVVGRSELRSPSKL